MLKKEIARTHSEYWDHQNNDQIHQQLKILETAPQISTKRDQLLGSKAKIGVMSRT